MITFNYIASFFLIVLGLYCIVTKYNLVKTVIGLNIMDYGVNLLIIAVGYNHGGTASSSPPTTASCPRPSRPSTTPRPPALT